MSVLGVFDRRYRGFRVIEIGGVGVLLALILLVYLAKTIAGSEAARIEHVQQQIADERARVTLLRAEVASLEQPERLEALSGRYLGLQPVDPKHDIDAEALAVIVRASAPPAPPVPQGAAPLPAAAPPAASMPAASPAVAAPAQPAVVQAIATAPKAAKAVPAKPLKVAAAVKPAVKPARPAALARAEAPQMAAEEPAPRRPSELRPAAADSIDSLVQSAQEAPADVHQ